MCHLCEKSPKATKRKHPSTLGLRFTTIVCSSVYTTLGKHASKGLPWGFLVNTFYPNRRTQVFNSLFLTRWKCSYWQWLEVKWGEHEKSRTNALCTPHSIIVTVVNNMFKQLLYEMIDMDRFSSHEITIKEMLLFKLCRENDTLQG